MPEITSEGVNIAPARVSPVDCPELSGNRSAKWLQLLSSQSFTRTALLIYALALFILLVVDLLFTAEPTWGDDQGLYNVVYNVITSGRTIYPLYGEPDTMTVHPPLHYFIVGMIARLGFHVYHAAGLVPLLWIVAIYWLVFRAPWPASHKLAIFTSVALVIGVYVPLTTIRPEVHLLTAWFCGLLLLELSRSYDWDKRYICVGSFCIAYSSGLHYWALPVNFALPAFLLLLWHERDFRAMLERLPSMIIGWLVFYIPYALLFWIQDWKTILETLLGTNATGSVVNSINSYFDIFRYGTLVVQWSMVVVGWAFYLPIALGMPLFVVAIPILFLTSRFRGLAVGGAPIAVFIFLFVPRKGGMFYTQPELLLYGIALTVPVFLGAARFSAVLPAKIGRIVLPLVALMVGLATVYSSKSAEFPLVPVRDEWDLVRSLSRTVVGSNALVGLNTLYPWYMSGGRYIYQFKDWGFSAKDVASDQVRRFDALVFQSDWLGNQRAAVPFPWLYLEGALKLQAVVMIQSGTVRRTQSLGVSYRWFSCYPALVFVTPQEGKRPVALVAQPQTGLLYNYRVDPNGNTVLVTMLVANSALEKLQNLTAQSLAYTNILIENNNKFDEVWLNLYLLERDKWNQLKDNVSEFARIRDAIPMSVSATPLSDMPAIPYNDTAEVITDIGRLVKLRP